MTDVHTPGLQRLLTDATLRMMTTEALYRLSYMCEVEPADATICDACAAYLIAQEKDRTIETFEPPLFVTYQMEDGSHIDEYSFVTGLEWFDDRDREIRLMKRTYKLVAEELVILPDPYPSEDDEPPT